MAKTYIKGNPVSNATQYSLNEKASDGTYSELTTSSEINFEVSALNLEAGSHTLVVKAKADGYEDSDYSNEVVYIVEEGEAEWEVYSPDGLATVTEENGVPTVTATNNKAVVFMKNTNQNFSFVSPAASASDGGRMVIIGRYDSNILAFRPRGADIGTNLQRYDYTTFGGGVLTTDAAATSTFAQGDTLSVTWSGNTATLSVNGVTQSSFDCSTYVANETWKKCAGFMYTNFTSSTVTLADFTLL